MDDPELIKTIAAIEFAVVIESADTKKYLDDAYNRFAEMIKKLGIKRTMMSLRPDKQLFWLLVSVAVFLESIRLGSRSP
jgi:hypothetical protein